MPYSSTVTISGDRYYNFSCKSEIVIDLVPAMSRSKNRTWTFLIILKRKLNEIVLLTFR